MTRTPSILETMDDSALFASWFAGPSWNSWRAVLAALFGLPMTKRERRLFRKITGRRKVPTKPAEEAWLVVGRRGGKSFITALVAVYLACFREWAAHLAPGERGVVMVIASDRRQSRVILRYVKALISGVEMLAKMVERETSSELDLSNGITIEIHTASYTSTRGYTVVALLADELGFWRTDNSANPDREILQAIRPAMATVPGALLVGLSTPYRRAGVLWEAFRDHYGKDGDPVLVIQADSRTMNPTLPAKVVTAAYERDAISAAAEYGAEFRSDIAGFLDDAWIECAVDSDRPPELPPKPELQYHAFCDPSGGRSDAFTVCIAHHEDGLSILDVCRGRKPPFNPSDVVGEFSEVLKRYNLHTVNGDHYSAEWCIECFREAGIQYEASKLTKSEIYIETGPLFATGAVRIPDHRTLLNELRMLERRTAPSGKDTIQHPPRSHDDYSNSACGALLAASHRSVEMTSDMFKSGPRSAAAEFGVTGYAPAPAPFDLYHNNY